MKEAKKIWFPGETKPWSCLRCNFSSNTCFDDFYGGCGANIEALRKLNRTQKKGRAK